MRYTADSHGWKLGAGGCVWVRLGGCGRVGVPGGFWGSPGRGFGRLLVGVCVCGCQRPPGAAGCFCVPGGAVDELQERQWAAWGGEARLRRMGVSGGS